MNHTTTKTGRIIMALVTLLSGLLILFLIPKLGINVFEGVLKAVETRAFKTGDPTLFSAKKLFTFFYAFWSGLTIAAGAVAILLSYLIYKGEYLARAVALGFFAIPAITGAFMFGPILLFIKSLIGISLIVALLGLIPYFIILLWDKSSVKEKIINFTLFLFIGIETAYSFTNGQSSFRMFMGWAEGAARTTEYYFYAFGIPVIWFGVIMGLISIPLYAIKKKSGYWLATGGSFLMLIGTIIFYLAKPNGWFTTGIILTLITFILLIIPAIGKSLLRSNDKKEYKQLEELG